MAEANKRSASMGDSDKESTKAVQNNKKSFENKKKTTK